MAFEFRLSSFELVRHFIVVSRGHGTSSMAPARVKERRTTFLSTLLAVAGVGWGSDAARGGASG